MKRKRGQSGFTMIEATIAMVILAIAAAGILLPFANAATVQVEGARQTLAANLASELMEKVLLSEPNDILVTYADYTEAKGAMLDTLGSPLTDSVYDGFSRSATSQPATVASVDLVAVTVTVDYLNNQMTHITTLISK
ncbi:MAG: type IV pilus modification PilV family protein [Planctomycetota bacterium]|jgi:prepilin-type N-terminal cleavage/methylation domain-containing protein